MAIHQTICNVLPTPAEYFKKAALSSGDSIELCFEGEVTISNLVMQIHSGSASGIRIEIEYPASKAVLIIQTGLADSYYLNVYDDNEANIWYCLPAGAKLRAYFESATGAVVTLCAIG